MISFSKLMYELLTERMNFRQLFAGSERGRRQRGKRQVRSKSVGVKATDDGETWTFSYKSSPSTTGQRWHGFIRFFKDDASHKDNAMDLDCMVDCDCPDYRYRYAYNNAQADVGFTGKHSDWKYNNQNNGNAPRPRSQGGVGDYGVGLCKHLCGLTEYLKTNMGSDAPEPEDEVEPVEKPKIKKQNPATAPQTSKAPDPDDSYSDSRGDSSSYSDGRELQEESQQGLMFGKIDQFVKNNPVFEVPYEE